MTIMHNAQRVRSVRDRSKQRATLTSVPIPIDVVEEPVRGAEELIADALAAARESRERAEKDVRRAEIERARAARALEYNLHPVTLDEATRARLRAEHGAAAQVVADKQRIVEQARALESAAATIADAIAGDHDAAHREAGQLLAQLLADAATPDRGGPGSARRAPRAARPRDIRPQ